jgi:hypothetical protein
MLSIEVSILAWPGYGLGTSKLLLSSICKFFLYTFQANLSSIGSLHGFGVLILCFSACSPDSSFVRSSPWISERSREGSVVRDLWEGVTLEELVQGLTCCSLDFSPTGAPGLFFPGFGHDFALVPTPPLVCCRLVL